MTNKTLTIIILIVLTAIIAVILIDFQGNKRGKKGGNPYKYEMEDLSKVDSSLIHYRETRNISLGEMNAHGFDLKDNTLYVTGEQFLMAIHPDGNQLFLESLEDTGTCMKVTEDFIYVGFEDHIGKFNRDGELIGRWQKLNDRAVITSLASKENRLYAADAGNRRVLIFNEDGSKMGEFAGKSESAAGHGFIVPSPCFDLVINSYGDLWVVNPGEHAIENYTDDGEMRGYWQTGSMNIEGFLGCCNPAEITVLDDGSFVTSEKGLVRIKIYDESGKLLSVVAPPSKFKEEGKAPEVVADEEGLIYALDFDRNTIRIFEKNK